MSKFQDYESHGWKLCGIKPGSKAPDYPGWSVAALPAESIDAIGYGAGLLHALSGTCSLDIDAMEPARIWWAEHGVDIDALLAEPGSVHIKSGRAGRDKLLYRLKTPLRTIKPSGSGFELRCATAGGDSVQCVLPESTHPVTQKKYEWFFPEPLVGDWRKLPNIPAKVFAVWRELADSEPVRELINAPPQAASMATVREAAAAYAKNLDLAAYDDWIALGMRIHKQTKGSAQGFALWNEFSKAADKYHGLDDLKMHWVSFDAGGALGLDQMMPATRDDFEDVAEAVPGEATTAMADMARIKATYSDAREFLKERLIYVKDYEQYFDRENHRIFRTNFGLEHEFAHKMPKKNGTHVSVVKMLKDLGAGKHIVNGIGFHPGEGVIFTERGDRYANVYRARLPEPLKPMPAELLILEWLFDRIDDVTYREWLIQFYGHVVQHPGVKIKSAPLIWSETQGNGKTTLIAKLPALLVGQQYSVEMSNDVLSGEFNDELRHAWHVNLSEFSGGSRRENDQVTKKVERWIVEDSIDLHQKGLGATTIPNHFFLTASSNKSDAASITNDDRKWAIHEMHAPPMTEQETATLFEGFLKTPRAAGVLRHYFLAVNLAGFNPNARAPVTEAKTAMAKSNVTADVELLTELFEQRSEMFSQDIVITSEVRDYVHKHCVSRPSSDRIGKILVKPPFNGTADRFRFNSGVYRAIVLYNADRWAGTTGKDKMAHIRSIDISNEDPLLD